MLNKPLIFWIPILLLFAACSRGDDRLVEKQFNDLVNVNKKIVETERRGEQSVFALEQRKEGVERELQFLEFQMSERQSLVERVLGGLGFKSAETSVAGGKKPEEEGIIDKYNFVYRALHSQQDSTIGDQTGEIDTAGVFASGEKLRRDFQVFGWHPYWMNGAFKGYNFELLSILSYFSYDLNPTTGGYRNAQPVREWETTTLIDSAKKAGTKVLLTVSNHGRENNRIFLTNILAQQNLIDSLIFLLRFRDADGVDIDFENIPPGYGEAFTDFMGLLYLRLAAQRKKYMITVCLPAMDLSKSFNMGKLDKWVDYFVIMGYDLHGSNSTTAGPVSPLRTGRKWNTFSLENAVAHYLRTGIARGKLIMGLPYYGAVWQVSDEDDGQNAQFLEHLTYKEIRKYYDNGLYPKLFDEESVSYSISLPGGNGHKECWFDDESTLGLKYDWIQRQGIAGVGLWALGYDNGMPQLWELLADKFGTGNREPKTPAPFLLVDVFRNYRNVFIAAGAFFLIFLVLGFIGSLLDWRVRDALFYSRFSRLLFASIIFLGILVLLTVTGIIENKMLLMAGGLLLGLAIALTANGAVSRKRRKLP